jgi:two-component system, OmpR family, alkaline phosphatase synthesis response regulator PhoP
MAPKTILVADDECHILHVVSVKLSNAGYRVLTANDGREALDIALAEHPDLIITDYQMPHMSGLELCAQLQQNPDSANIPAILLTARGYSLDLTNDAPAGIRSMIAKPFSPRQLLQTVQDMLSAAA